MTLRTNATRPGKQWLALVAGIIVLMVAAATVALALSDTGTHSVEVDSKADLLKEVDIGNALVAYIPSSGDNQSSGTGLFDPFVRLQGSPTENGYNTDGAVQFDTKTGKWTHAIRESAIPRVPCEVDEDPDTTEQCWELFVDINEGNNATYISLTRMEIWSANSPTLVGYNELTHTFASGATPVYDFVGEIQINDVNQGSGRGDLRYLVPVQSFPNPWFVLYSEWGSTTAAPDGKTYASEGGFEEWKVRKAPNVTILKTADPLGPVNAGATIGFDITISNTGAAAATNVVLNDQLPTAGGLNWSLVSAVTGCTLSATDFLSCTFATLASGASITIELTSPTTAAACGLVENTASFTADGDLSGSDDADVTVNCGALQILKNSVKGGAVASAGAVFSVDGPDANTDSDFTVTDDTTAAAPDEAAAVGVVCVTGLAPGAYTVTETTAPSGYAVDTGAETATVVSGSTCASPGTGTVTFVNPPLYDIQVNFRDGGSGETSPTSISCTGTNGTGSTTAATGWDDSLTFEDEPLTANPETIVCTIVVDP